MLPCFLALATFVAAQDSSDAAATPPVDTATDAVTSPVTDTVTTPDAPVESTPTTTPQTTPTVTQPTSPTQTQPTETQVTQTSPTTAQTSPTDTAPVASSTPQTLASSVVQSTIVSNGVTLVSSSVALRPTSLSAAVRTNADGLGVIVVEGLTTTVELSAASEVAASIVSASAAGTLNLDEGGSGSGSSTKKWAVPVGVIAGLVGAALLAYLGYRLFRKRYSGLDDDAIKWPELPADSNGVLMAEGVHRRHGAGVGDDDEDDRKSHTHTLSRGSSMMFGQSPMSVQRPFSDYPHQQQGYYDQPIQMSERHSAPMNYGMLAQNSSLPPGAAMTNRSASPIMPRSFSPSGATSASTTEHESYRDAPTDLPYSTAFSSDGRFTPVPLEDRPLMDRVGTVRSQGTSQRLGIANPSEDDH